MATKCEDCGKLLQSRKAYAGHMLLAHGKRVGFMAEFDARMREVSELGATLNRMNEAIVLLAAMHGAHVDFHDKTSPKYQKEYAATLQQRLSGPGGGPEGAELAQVPKVSTHVHGVRVCPASKQSDEV